MSSSPASVHAYVGQVSQYNFILAQVLYSAAGLYACDVFILQNIFVFLTGFKLSVIHFTSLPLIIEGTYQKQNKNVRISL